MILDVDAMMYYLLHYWGGKASWSSTALPPVLSCLGPLVKFNAFYGTTYINSNISQDSLVYI